MQNSLKKIPHAICLTALLLTSCSLSAAEVNNEKSGPTGLENSVVKVFSTARKPDHLKPWGKEAASDGTGSGVIISGKRILTNAHVVRYASQVEILANQSGDKITATVVAIAPDIDLAVLKVDDESFFDKLPAMQRASLLPEIKDTVMAYGFPMGGNSLSITKGIVSRIEFTRYWYHASGLRIQVDAAINPGNSGGPVVANNKMIGLAFSGISSSQNISYIIPNEEIEIFLKDIEDGHYDGKPALFDNFQSLENPSLRTYLKLEKNVQGIMVSEPFGRDENYPLKEWDVITAIGNKPVDNQGMVKIRPNLSVRFNYYIQQFSKQNAVPLTIHRNGKNMVIEVPTVTTPNYLLTYLMGTYPSYFVYGPMVFSVASKDLISAFGKAKLSSKNAIELFSQANERADANREELVAVPAPLFPHKSNVGYDNRIAGSILESVNGIAIRSLAHLVATLRDQTTEYVVFRFENNETETIVLPRKDIDAVTEEILTDNGIRAQGSNDMMKIWTSKK